MARWNDRKNNWLNVGWHDRMDRWMDGTIDDTEPRSNYDLICTALLHGPCLLKTDLVWLGPREEDAVPNAISAAVSKNTAVVSLMLYLQALAACCLMIQTLHHSRRANKMHTELSFLCDHPSIYSSIIYV